MQAIKEELFFGRENSLTAIGKGRVGPRVDRRVDRRMGPRAGRRVGRRAGRRVGRRVGQQRNPYSRAVVRQYALGPPVVLPC